MKNLEAIKLKLDKMLAENNAQKKEIQPRLEKAMQKEANAKANMEAATETADEAKYKKAVAEYRDAQDLVGMLKRKRSSINSPLIDEAEYKAIAGEIIKELDQITQADKRRAAEHAQKLLDIKAANSEVISYGNELLRRLQTDLYQAKSKYVKDSPPLPAERLEYKNYDLLQIIQRMEGDIIWIIKE